jgi:hypothetical protein
MVGKITIQTPSPPPPPSTTLPARQFSNLLPRNKSLLDHRDVTLSCCHTAEMKNVAMEFRDDKHFIKISKICKRLTKLTRLFALFSQS